MEENASTQELSDASSPVVLRQEPLNQNDSCEHGKAGRDHRGWVAEVEIQPGCDDGADDTNEVNHCG